MNDDMLTAAVEVIGRTGARQFEVAYDDDVEPVVWNASCSYQGARVFVEGYTSPDTAADALARKLIEGGQCVVCGGRITTTLPVPKGCSWRRVGAHWLRGCDGKHGGVNVPQNRKQRRQRRRRR